MLILRYIQLQIMHYINNIVYYILCLLYVYALRFEHLHWVDIAHYKNSLLLLLLYWTFPLKIS